MRDGEKSLWCRLVLFRLRLGATVLVSDLTLIIYTNYSTSDIECQKSGCQPVNVISIGTISPGRQYCTLKDCAGEIRAVQISPLQVSAAQVGCREIGVAQIGPAHIRTG